MGAEPVSADVLEATSVNEAFKRIRPDAVINELTSLPRHYTPAEMRAAAERDRKVRIEGNANLLAAIGDLGVRRYLLQTSGFSYAPGAGLADESTPFIVDASPGVAASARTYAELEAQASRTQNLEFVALRYGFFYGPGTWYTAEGDMGEQVRRRQVPIIGEGQGVWNFVHIDDAAAATAAALECPPPHSWTAIPRLRMCGFLRSPAQQTHRRPRKSRSRMHRHRPDRMRFTTRRVCAAHRTRKPVAP